MSEPTYVSTHIVNQEKAQFPAVTICPISKGYKEDVLQVGLTSSVLFFVNPKVPSPQMVDSLSPYVNLNLLSNEGA